MIAIRNLTTASIFVFSILSTGISIGGIESPLGTTSEVQVSDLPDQKAADEACGKLLEHVTKMIKDRGEDPNRYFTSKECSEFEVLINKIIKRPVFPLGGSTKDCISAGEIEKDEIKKFGKSIYSRCVTNYQK